MLYIAQNDDLFKDLDWTRRFCKILEGFVVKNFGEYFKWTQEKLCSKVNEKQNLRKFT